MYCTTISNKKVNSSPTLVQSSVTVSRGKFFLPLKTSHAALTHTSDSYLYSVKTYNLNPAITHPVVIMQHISITGPERKQYMLNSDLTIRNNINPQIIVYVICQALKVH